VFAVPAVLALGASHGAITAGIDVPGALSIVGFDDIDDAARSTPPLTTVSQGLLDQGRLAARLLLDAITGAPGAAPQVRAALVVRGTTAKAR
jgi:LacI family transcriptional regulator